jgi:hypothetical protein
MGNNRPGTSFGLKRLQTGLQEDQEYVYFIGSTMRAHAKIELTCSKKLQLSFLPHSVRAVFQLGLPMFPLSPLSLFHVRDWLPAWPIPRSTVVAVVLRPTLSAAAAAAAAAASDNDSLASCQTSDYRCVTSSKGRKRPSSVDIES